MKCLSVNFLWIDSLIHRCSSNENAKSHWGHHDVCETEWETLNFRVYQHQYKLWGHRGGGRSVLMKVSLNTNSDPSHVSVLPASCVKSRFVSATNQLHKEKFLWMRWNWPVSQTITSRSALSWMCWERPESIWSSSELTVHCTSSASFRNRPRKKSHTAKYTVTVYLYFTTFLTQIHFSSVLSITGRPDWTVSSLSLCSYKVNKGRETLTGHGDSSLSHGSSPDMLSHAKTMQMVQNGQQWLRTEGFPVPAAVTTPSFTSEEFIHLLI